MAVENLVLPVLANSAGSSSVTQPVSTAFIKFRLLPKFPRRYALTCQSGFCHIGMRMSVFLEMLNLPSIAETLMMCFFLCCLSSSLRKALTQIATEFTNCTSIISVVSICPNLVASCLFFVNLLAEGRHRVLLRKNLRYQGIVKRIGICDNLAEARNPIPGSGPCQVTGIFSLDENQWSTL
jgi:hypothetical protein